MIIALFPNRTKPESKNISLGVVDYLQTHGCEIAAPDDLAKELGCKAFSEIDHAAIDFLVTMGGDGTILQLAHDYPEFDAPILGINLGHLGFMADVPIPDLYPSLQDLINGAYSVEERVVLSAHSNRGEDLFAINDVVAHRARNASLIEVSIHIDGIYLNTFEADGLIVATPNGSTAYSLAAGGPILNPNLEAIVITPICAHTISNRPIVLPPSNEIQIQYLSDYDPIEVIADGIDGFELQNGEAFRITRSEKIFKLVNLFRRDYFSTLRSKLGWAGKLR